MNVSMNSSPTFLLAGKAPALLRAHGKNKILKWRGGTCPPFAQEGTQRRYTHTTPLLVYACILSTTELS